MNSYNYTKIKIGSTYEPNQDTIQMKTINKINNPKQNQQVWLEFKNKQNFPLVYIMDLVENTISKPILATPLYKCDECDKSIVYMDYNQGRAVCNKCMKQIEITPHLFFITNVYHFRRNVSITTTELKPNGVPLNWELKTVKKIIAHTYNDKERIYDSGIIMESCDTQLIDKYKKIANITNKQLKNKKSFKILIYRNLTKPIYNHHGVGLELQQNKWKIISVEDKEQFMTKVMPLIDMPEVYINIENMNEETKKMLKTDYLNLIGGTF